MLVLSISSNKDFFLNKEKYLHFCWKLLSNKIIYAALASLIGMCPVTPKTFSQIVFIKLTLFCSYVI